MSRLFLLSLALAMSPVGARDSDIDPSLLAADDACAGTDSEEQCGLSLRQLRGEALHPGELLAVDEEKSEEQQAPTIVIAPQFSYNFNYDWHKYFPDEQPAQPPSQSVVQQGCRSYGCIDAFDFTKITDACQCFPGCDATPFGNVCCGDYKQACGQKPPAPDVAGLKKDYTKFQNANCYSGHGAGSDVGQVKNVQGANQCAKYCNDDRRCNCFVLHVGGDCFKRSSCKISDCAVSSGVFSTFVKNSALAEESCDCSWTSHPGACGTNDGSMCWKECCGR